ncbi:MAG: carotenoid biosynthesis protein [Flavobacteriales bacterium]
MKQTNINSIIILVTHLVGAIALSVPALQPIFKDLTPFHLLLSTLLLLISQSLNVKIFRLFLVLFSIGFFVEVIGVKTGILFGNYQYGETLGIKWFNTPLLIGINWFLLSIATFGVFQKILRQFLVLIFTSSIFMVGLDFLIEPVAISLDFWSWQGGQIPMQNYIMWFLVSLVMHSIIFYSKITFNFLVCLSVILGQTLFFLIQNIYIGIF